VDLGLSDRVYVVTGASRGLGRACAHILAGEGARLVLSGRDEAALQSTAAEVGGPDRAIAVSGDLSEPGLETCLAAAAVARYGRLDGAIVSLGSPAASTFMLTDDGQWRLGFESTFLAPVRLARTVARHVSNEGGSVLFVLSVSARQALADQVLANALRPALAMTAKTMADELGPRNVRVNAVIPGAMEYDRPRSSAELSDGEDARRRLEDTVPLRRLGEPHEFARPAVFLLSPAASYVTGTMLTVDGGTCRGL
jgi:3-oxoacyl-[acyl-carrier protein] reductase